MATQIPVVIPIRRRQPPSHQERHAVLADIASSLRSLNLEVLDKSWVEDVLEAEFTECPDLDANYDNNVVVDVARMLQSVAEKATELIHLIKVCQENGESTENSSFWTYIISNDVEYESLIALMLHYMESGLRPSASQLEKDKCLQAAGLYFVLLAMPESGAYGFKIFRPGFYRKAISTLKLATNLRSPKINPTRMSRGRGRPSCSRSRSRASSTTSWASESSDGGSTTSSQLKGVQDLAVGLHKVLGHLVTMLKFPHTKMPPESLEFTVQELVELTSLRGNSIASVASLARMAYHALYNLCKPALGDVVVTIRLIFSALLPGIFMTPRGLSDNSPKGLEQVRKQSLFFVKGMITKREHALDPAAILIQDLAVKVVDRAEARQKSSKTILEILKVIPDNYYAELVRWFYMLAHDEKHSRRHMALEVLGGLLAEDQRNFQEKLKRNDHLLSSHKYLFGLIVSRCVDAAVMVRSKALQTLAETITKPVTSDQDEVGDGTEVDFIRLLQDPEADVSEFNPLPSFEGLLELLRERAMDESVFARKYALQALENILKFPGLSESLLLEIVAILADHCRDPSVLIRKQMVQSLTEVMNNHPDNVYILNRWVDGVMPLVLEMEQKAAEKILESIWALLIENLIAKKVCLPWKIMAAINQLKMTKYLSRACDLWSKEAKWRPGLVQVLNILDIQIREDGDNNNNVGHNWTWLLMAQISSHVPIPDPQHILDFFIDAVRHPEGVGRFALLQMLNVLKASLTKLDRQSRRSLETDLLTMVEHFAMPEELIATAVDILTILSKLEAGSEMKKYQTLLESWAQGIIETIHEELKETMVQPCSTVELIETSRMMRQIFTLGELSLICPHKIEDNMFVLLQNTIDRERQQPPDGSRPTARLQGAAVISLAKMCLQNQRMVKLVVPALGGLLPDAASDSRLKSNVMIALSDMCVRYASLVDPLLPQMTACLKDPVLAVRQTTLTTLINLLQEDYLKLNSNFLFRLLQTLLDEDEVIRDLSTFFIQQRLLKRMPKVMYYNFVESLFHFNDYQGHDIYNKSIQNECESRLFSMVGKESQDDRLTLYKFMLEHMDDAQRYKTAFKICKDVLNGVVDGTVTLRAPNSIELFQDSLLCLTSDEIKVSSYRCRQDEDAASVDASIMPWLFLNDTSVSKAAKKSSTITKEQKVKDIENILGIVMALTKKLDQTKSLLKHDLMTYLRVLMADYKCEIKEIFANDCHLAHQVQDRIKEADARALTLESREGMLRWEVQKAMAAITNRRHETRMSDANNRHHQTDLCQFLERNLSRLPLDGDSELPTEEQLIANFTPKITTKRVSDKRRTSTRSASTSSSSVGRSDKENLGDSDDESGINHKQVSRNKSNRGQRILRSISESNRLCHESNVSFNSDISPSTSKRAKARASKIKKRYKQGKRGRRLLDDSIEEPIQKLPRLDEAPEDELI